MRVQQEALDLDSQTSVYISQPFNVYASQVKAKHWYFLMDGKECDNPKYFSYHVLASESIVKLLPVLISMCNICLENSIVLEAN